MYFDVLLLYQNLCCTGCISCVLMYQFLHGLASRHNWRFWMSHCVRKRWLIAAVHFVLDLAVEVAR